MGDQIINNSSSNGSSNSNNSSSNDSSNGSSNNNEDDYNDFNNQSMDSDNTVLDTEVHPKEFNSIVPNSITNTSDNNKYNNIMMMSVGL